MNVGSLTISLAARTAGLSAAGVRVKLFERGIIASVGRINNSIRSVGMSFMALTIPIAGFGVTATKTFSEFEFSLAKIKGLVGIAGDVVDDWGDKILKLGPKLAQTPKDLANAMYYITTGGVRDSAAAMEVLEWSSKAAAAGLGEVAVIADAATSAMNAYGHDVLNAKQATDTLVMAIREGKAEPQAFATAIGVVFPVAAKLGVSFAEVGGAMAGMTRTGTKAGTSATMLRRLLTSMLRPAQGARDAMDNMDGSFYRMRETLAGGDGLIPVLKEMKGMIDYYGETRMAEAIPNIRAILPLFDLLGPNYEYNIKSMERMKQVTGTTTDALEEAAKTFQFKWKNAIGSIQSSFVRFGKSIAESLIPTLKKITDFISRLADKWEALSEGQRQSIIHTVKIIALIGPLILGFQLLIAPLIAIAGLVISIANSFVGFAVGIMAVIQLLKQIKNVQEGTDLAKFMSNLGTYMGALLSKIKIFAWIVGIVFNDMFGRILEVLVKPFDFMIKTFNKITGSKIPMFEFDSDALQEQLHLALKEAEKELAMFEELKPGGGQSWNWVDQLFGDGSGNAKDAGKQLLGSLKEDAVAFFKDVGQKALNLVPGLNGLLGLFSGITDEMKKVMDFSMLEMRMPTTMHKGKPSKQLMGLDNFLPTRTTSEMDILEKAQVRINDLFETYGFLIDTSQRKLEAFADTFEKIYEMGGPFSEKDLENIQDIFEAINKEEGILKLKDKLEGFANFMGSTFKKELWGALDALKLTGEEIERAMTMIEALAPLLSSAFEGFGQALAGAENPFDGFIDMLISAVAQLGAMLLAVGAAMLLGVAAFPGLAIKASSALAAGAALSILAGVAKGSRSKNKAGNTAASSGPKFAKGGMVPGGYPNDSYFANLSSGELVVPADQSKSFLDIVKQHDIGGSNRKYEFDKQEMQINVIGQIRGTDIHYIVQEIERKNRNSF